MLPSETIPEILPSELEVRTHVDDSKPVPLEHPYASFLAQVEKPSRYVGGEFGSIKKDWEKIEGKMCLAFPDVYDIGMSHLGFKILYGIVNGHPKLLAERAYTPWTDLEAELRKHNEPLRSLESWRPLKEFDVVGFSLQFELTFTNILTMLDLGGIPIRSEDRSNEDPLILAGGPTATHCEPMAPFLDAVVIGDGEEKTSQILLAWTTLRKAGMPRRERLRELAKLTGVYVPSLYETELEEKTGMQVVKRPDDSALPFPVQRTLINNLNDYPFPTSGPVSATETVFDRVSVEIARGCTEGCRFCQAGMIYRPVRERDPESIVQSIESAVREGGYDEASLTCLSTADYSAINPLVREVMKRFEGQKVALSVSSLRAYGLDEELLDEIKKVRATGLTFAPEAGTQRMRDVVNKNVTEEQLMTTAERVFSRGWTKMKLYFMIGLPTEEEEDIRGIVQTGSRAQDVGKRIRDASGDRGKAKPEVTVSVSIHVPKPHTPFQWCAMDSSSVAQTKQGWLREEARKNKVELKTHDSDGPWIEGMIARGDRTMASVIESAWKHGARFDSWDERLNIKAWEDALDETMVSPKIFLGTIPVDARLPWDHLDVGLEEGFLLREYRKAVASRLSPPCGKVAGMFVHHTNLQDAEKDSRRLVCYDCGVACDLTAMRDERLVFLRKLNAEEKTQKAIDAAARAEEKLSPDYVAPVPTPKKNPRTKVKPTTDFAQGKATRIRLGYRKVGTASYRGHLDLVRLLPRIFRRADVPLYYTEGFHPRPDMVFGPALSLGISSLAEYMDLKLDGNIPFSVEGLAERLNANTEEGIEFFGCKALAQNDAGLNKLLDQATYLIFVPELWLREQKIDQESLQSKWLELKASSEAFDALRVRRDIKGIGKWVSVSPYLADIRFQDSQQAFERAGLIGNGLKIEIDLRMTNDGTLRASEALEAVFGFPSDAPVRMIRTKMLSHKFGAALDPLECVAQVVEAAPAQKDQPFQETTVLQETAPLQEVAW